MMQDYLLSPQAFTHVPRGGNAKPRQGVPIKATEAKARSQLQGLQRPSRQVLMLDADAALIQPQLNTLHRIADILDAVKALVTSPSVPVLLDIGEMLWGWPDHAGQ